MRRKLPLCIAAYVAAASGPTALAQAPQLPVAPQASLVMQPMSEAQLRWAGTGAGKGAVAFCVSSTTGRYALTVNSATGHGLAGAGPVNYSVRFESEGHTQSAVLSARSPVARFSGTVSPDRNCERGPNARIVVAVEQRDALAATAGSYSDHVSLVVEPS